MANDEKLKALIVDDEVNIRSALRRFLVAEGFIVFEASNGFEAIESVGQNKPDIIIMDGRMPQMDGLEACKRLKDNPETKDIPIIFSTGTHVEDVEEGRVAADDYMVKPYSPEEIYEKIIDLAKSRRKN